MVSPNQPSVRRVFDDVLQKIRVDIARGAIRPGQRLPPERRLAAEYQVSRASIREVVRVLELAGLVTVKRGRDGGAMTTEDCRQIAQGAFTSLVPLDRYRFLELLEFREIVEPKAAALAAIRANEQHRQALRRSLAMMSRAASTPETQVESNLLFHETIAQAAGNLYLQSLLPQVLGRHIPPAVRRGAPAGWSVSRFFHAKIADAIARRDATDAEVWMEAHLAHLEHDLRMGLAFAGNGRGAGNGRARARQTRDQAGCPVPGRHREGS
jgi:GntR family transcriptional repressor for pyruvate dehydrogenase complex